MGLGFKERLPRKEEKCKHVLPWALAIKRNSFELEGIAPKTSCHGPGLERATPLEKKESLQTRPAMYLGYKERLLRKEGITPDTSCHGPGLSRATPSKGKNQSKDVLPWAWAIKSDSFERKESLRIRPAMGLGFQERLPRKEGINPKTSCHGLGL